MGDLGLIENVSAAVRTGRINRKALDLFRKGGIIHALARHVYNKRINPEDLSQMFEWFMNQRFDLSVDQKRAKEILGDLFVSPVEMCQALNWEVVLSEEDLALLGPVPYSEAKLLEAKKRKMILFPKVPGINPRFIHWIFKTNEGGHHPHFDKGNHKTFTRNRDFGWYYNHEMDHGWGLISTEPVEDSRGTDFFEQNGLIPEGYERAGLLDLILAYVFFFYKTDCVLCPDSTMATCEMIRPDSGNDRMFMSFGDAVDEGARVAIRSISDRSNSALYLSMYPDKR